MNSLWLFSMFMAGSLALAGCRQGPDAAQQEVARPRQAEVSVPVAKAAEYHSITPQEAKERLDRERTIRLVDVRTEEEYRARHIANSLLIPDYDIEKLAPKLLPNKDDVIFVYCRSGRRSRQAATRLVEMGYTNVYDFGGIVDWPYDTVSGE